MNPKQLKIPFPPIPEPGLVWSGGKWVINPEIEKVPPGYYTTEVKSVKVINNVVCYKLHRFKEEN